MKLRQFLEGLGAAYMIAVFGIIIAYQVTGWNALKLLPIGRLPIHPGADSMFDLWGFGTVAVLLAPLIAGAWLLDRIAPKT